MEEFKSKHAYFCWICGNAVELESCKTDERGMAVHGHCYLQKVTVAAELMPLAVKKPAHRIRSATSLMTTQPRTRIHPVTTAPPAPTEPQAPAWEDRIRARAYQLYEERAKLEGHALEDWLQAESELLPAVASRSTPEEASNENAHDIT